MLKLEDGKIREWSLTKDTTKQDTLEKYFDGKFGEALTSPKNS